MNNHTLIKSVLECLAEDINKYKSEILELKHKLNTRNKDDEINKIIVPPVAPVIQPENKPTAEVTAPSVNPPTEKKSRADYQKSYQKKYRDKKKLELAELKAKVKP